MSRKPKNSITLSARRRRSQIGWKLIKTQERRKESFYTFNFIVGAQPSFSLISVLSELRPRTPSGPGMCWMGMLLFSKLRTISAISFMLTISSLPIFTGSRKSDLVNLKGKVDNEHNAEFYQEIRTNLKTDIQKAHTKFSFLCIQPHREVLSFVRGIKISLVNIQCSLS